jgi:hypothetical protein
MHDAIEAVIEQIASEYRQTVASIVMEVTDDKSLPKAERKRCKSSRLVANDPELRFLAVPGNTVGGAGQ